MTKTLTTLAAVAACRCAVAAPHPPSARSRRSIAAGVIGGLAAGAIIGGATRSYGYYDGGYYGAWWRRTMRPVATAACVVNAFWDGYGWRVRRVQVCY